MANITRLKELRIKSGLSQSELAIAGGVNYRMLQDYEQGRKDLSHAKADMVVRLSHVLGCSVEELIEFDADCVSDNASKLSHMDHRMLLYTIGLADKNRIGSVDIEIDEIVPCLKDTESGVIVDTAVIKLESRSFLKTFQSNNGWHIDWDKCPEGVEVYALIAKDTNEIQGLIGLRNDDAMKAAYIYWACAAPQNNYHDTGCKKYIGVGGHLFAIAVDKSFKWGYSGDVYGFASCRELLDHYCEMFGAMYVGILHIYHFIITGTNATKLLEVYNYEWNS